MNKQSPWSFMYCLTMSHKNDFLLVSDGPYSGYGATANGQDKIGRYVKLCPVVDGFDLLAC